MGGELNVPTASGSPYWKDRIRMPEVEQAYNNSDSSTNIEAWYHGIEAGPYNAGVNVSSYSTQKEVLSKDSSREAVFDGGFAGKCENDQVWQYVEDANRWKCSGDIPWDQTVYLPEFENDDHVGLIFPPYNFINDLSNIPDYIYEVNSTTGNVIRDTGIDSFETAWDEAPHKSGQVEIDSIDARCWNGTKGISESQIHNNESYIQSNFNVNVTDWFSISVPDNPSDPVSNFRSLDHDGSYSCYWDVNVKERFTGNTHPDSPFSDAQNQVIEMHNYMGQSSPSSPEGVLVKNMTEDSSYAGSLPDMTGSDHTWTNTELTNQIISWN